MARNNGPARACVTNPKTGKAMVMNVRDWHYDGAAHVTDDPLPADLLQGVREVDVVLTGDWRPGEVVRP